MSIKKNLCKAIWLKKLTFQFGQSLPELPLKKNDTNMRNAEPQIALSTWLWIYCFFQNIFAFWKLNNLTNKNIFFCNSTGGMSLISSILYFCVGRNDEYVWSLLLRNQWNTEAFCLQRWSNQKSLSQHSMYCFRRRKKH